MNTSVATHKATALVEGPIDSSHGGIKERIEAAAVVRTRMKQAGLEDDGKVGPNWGKAHIGVTEHLENGS
ncbi:hypothetical protein Tco_0072988 [Tanacetum coccineum]